MPKRIFLIARRRLTEEGKTKVEKLLDKYPSLKGSYWAKEKKETFTGEKAKRKQLRSWTTLSSISQFGKEPIQLFL